MKLSLIIPTLNAEKEITSLLDNILKQTIQPDEIIIVDSASDDNTVKICKKFCKVKIIEINRKDFDHGGTRDMALRKSIGDIIIFMTQDAIPKNIFLIENLLKPFDDDMVACVTARQLPKFDASPIEKVIRRFNYPEERPAKKSQVKFS